MMVLRYVTYFYLLLIGLVVALFLLKRRDVHLFSLGTNLTSSYEEISNSFIKIFKNLLIIIILMVIVNAVAETITYEHVSRWTRRIVADYGVIVGVFLASLLSIFVHTWLNYRHRRMEIRKNGAALYNDLKNIINTFENTKRKVDIFCKESNAQKHLFDGIVPIREINYNGHWRDHYSVIHEQLPFKFYENIDTIYSSVEDFNKAVRNEDVRLLKRSVMRALPGQLQGYTDLQKLTPKQLVNGLGRLTQNKKVKSEVSSFLFNEFFYLIKKRLIYNKIEKQMIAIVKRGERLETTDIEKEIKTWLSLPEQKYINIISMGILSRVVFEAALKSKNIKLVWGECRLVGEKEPRNK